MSPERFSPDWYAPIVRHVVAPLWALRDGSPCLGYLRQFERSQYRPLDEVRSDQWLRFTKLLDHAGKHSPFYAERFAACGLQPGDIRSWEDLGRIPLLTKDDIRANKDRMVVGNIPREKLHRKKTSGSTGVSLEFFVDDESIQWKRGCAFRHDRWAHWDIGERIGAIWGNPQHRVNWRARLRNLLLERYLFLDTLKMDEQAMLGFYHDLRRLKPTQLFGHAHSLFLFARFLETRGLADIRPRGIISTCMVLHDFERQVIERVFDCKVTNRYGCEEVSLIACECPAHNGLHLNCDTLIVEFIRDGRPVAPGEPGAIVVTDLTNYGMPFIRYKVGDVGIPSARTCDCGCTYPLMESLEGRVADYVITPDGSYISGISLTENFAMLLGGIKQLQIVQEKIDHLVFRVVRGETYSEAMLQEIDRLVGERFGSSMHYDIEFVDSIQSERSGKYRFCISKLENPFS